MPLTKTVPASIPLGLALVLAALPLVAGSAAAEPPVASVEEAALAYLTPYVETGNFSGAILVARGDDVVLSRGVGLASRELGVPNRPATRFHLASVSKPFTVAAVLRLVAQGRLDLDAPLSGVLPGYPRGDQLTVHHLLANTSGIPNINRFDDYDEIALQAQTPESLVARFRELPLDFGPGERYDYSNSNANLLAYIIEQLSGHSYGEYLARELFAPLGLDATGHHSDAAAVIPDAAVGYAPRGVAEVVRAPWIDWSAKTGNGSLYSTTGDLYRFARALFGGEVLPRPLVERMLTEHTEGVGYGWFVRPRHGRRQLHVNGRSPGFSSYLGYYPDDELTVIVLSNLYNSVTTQVGSDLAAIALGEPYDAPALRTTPLPPAARRALVGRYQFGPDFYQPGFVMTVREDEDGFLHEDWGALIPVSETAFFDRAYWSTVRFELGHDGRATAMWFDDHRGQRIAEDSR